MVDDDRVRDSHQRRKLTIMLQKFVKSSVQIVVSMSKRKSNHHRGCQKRRRDPKKSRQVRSHVKVMLRVFFDSEGVVHYEFLPQGRTVIKEYYLEVMQRLREAVRKKKKDLMRGGRIDGCSNMTTRPHIHPSLSVTSWPNTRRLSFHSLRTVQISHQLTFSVSKAQINAQWQPF